MEKPIRSRTQRQMSLEECAEVLGLKPGLIAETERRALKKLRRWCEKRGLQSDDLVR